jgi:hypothetical protein
LEGRRVTIVSTNILWDIEGDYRLRYLRETYDIRADYIHRVCGGSLAFRAMELLLRLPKSVLRVLPDRLWSAFYFRTASSVVEVDRTARFLRSINARCIVIDEAQPNAGAIYAAAHRVKAPVVTMQTANNVLVPSNDDRPEPLENTDKIVVPNTLTRPYVDDSRVTVLGCSRYCREWQQINSDLLLRFFTGHDLPAQPDKLKVLIFGWVGKNFDVNHSTVQKILEIDFVEGIFKPRPRTTVPRKIYETNYSHYPSSRLIQWADVIVTSVTSVVLDALYRGKPVVYLKYIAPDEKATFENYNACWTIYSEEEALSALERIRDDPDWRPYTEGHVRRFMQDAVYAGECKRDVLGAYADLLERMAAAH